MLQPPFWKSDLVLAIIPPDNQTTKQTKRNKETNNQTNRLTNKQASKQTNKRLLNTHETDVLQDETLYTDVPITWGSGQMLAA